VQQRKQVRDQPEQARLPVLLLVPGFAYNALVKQLTLPIVIEQDADGYYVSCPALQGCYSQGDTYEEAIENIKDAIRLHVEDRVANGEEVPEKVSVSLSTVEVAV
jgi:predicted RNase H-like HicB family nuclease